MFQVFCSSFLHGFKQECNFLQRGWRLIDPLNGWDVKAEPAVPLACRANNWLYFTGAAVCILESFDSLP